MYFRNRQQVEKFLSYINSCHENINFTAELGYDNKLPFLDTLVTLNNNSFFTDLIRKKTFTDPYYDFGSLTLHAYKVSLVCSLIFRTYNFCSTHFSFHDELSRIKSFLVVKLSRIKSFLVVKAFLKENSSPMPLIDRVNRSFLDYAFSGKGEKHIVKDDKPTLYFSTPFLGHGSLHLKSCTSRLIKQFSSVQFFVILKFHYIQVHKKIEK